MFARVQNFDFNTPYQHLQQYTSSLYRSCRVFVNNNKNKLTNRLAEISTIGKEKATYSYEISKTFLFTYKYAAGATAAVAAVLLALKIFNKKTSENQDQMAKSGSPVEQKEPIEEEKIEESKKIIIPKPAFTLNPSFQVFNAKIEIPKIDLPPPNVAIHFCIDTSSSMVENKSKENREMIVKQAIKNILTHASKIVESSPGAVIGLTIVKFDTAGALALPYTEINQPNMEIIRSKIDSIQSEGGTYIYGGLERSYYAVKKRVEIDKTQSQILILLTDAETNGQRDLESCCKIIKSNKDTGVKFFAIGIGKGHVKKNLQVFSQSGDGTYINTSKDVNQIVPAVKKIFKTSIAPFQNLTLSNEKLPDSHWSLLKNTKLAQRILSLEIISKSSKKYNLGNLAYKKTLNLRILIHTSQLQHAETTFCLVYTDPLGKQDETTFTIPLTTGTIKINN